MVLLDNGGGHWRAGLAIQPAPRDLRHLVRHAWIERTHGRMGPWRVVPDASAHFIGAVVCRGGVRRLRLAFVGPRSRAADIDVADREVTFGIRLQPGVLSSLTGYHASDLADRVLPMDEVLPHALADLDLSANLPPELILRMLLRELRRQPAARAAAEMQALLAACGRVQDLAGVLGTPTRSLFERTRRDVGLAPKRLLRIMRLHRALHAARCRRGSWAGVAHDCGYADQAHLTRECSSLLGETPTRWAARATADSFKTPAPAVV